MKTDVKIVGKPPKTVLRKAVAAKETEDVLECLTPLQLSFAEEYIVDFNITQAAIRAGTQSKFPNRVGHAMHTNPKVRRAVNYLLATRADKSTIKPDYVIRKLISTVEKCEDDENYNPTAVLRGLELLARHLGMFVEKTEITGKDGGALQYEKISEDANDFARTISRLAKRGREDGASEDSDTGDSGSS